MATNEKNVGELDKAKSLAHVPWCGEYEKMISGMLYDAGASELAVARFKARKWTMHNNSFFPEDAQNSEEVSKARRKLLGDIIGDIDGDDICIEPPFLIDYGCNIKFGKRFYANCNLCILDCAIITIGDRVMLGPNVSIFGATRETDVQSRRDGVEFVRPVTIGDDCWIGGHSVILPGVTIGKGCTVAAGSIVTRDVPDWSAIAVGNSPADIFIGMPESLGGWEYTKGIKRLRDRQKHHGCTMPGRIVTTEGTTQTQMIT